MVSLVEDASGPGSNPWVLVGGFVLLTLLLPPVRLLSEIPTGTNKEENRMNGKQNKKKSNSNRTRKLWQYLMETMWAAGAGAIGSPLAALSQRT